MTAEEMESHFSTFFQPVIGSLVSTCTIHFFKNYRSLSLMPLVSGKLGKNLTVDEYALGIKNWTETDVKYFLTTINNGKYLQYCRLNGTTDVTHY